MTYRHRIALVACLLAAACNRQEAPNATSDKSQTITGAAVAKASETPGEHAGDCKDLPSNDQLKQWLKSTPGEAEAGGLMGGKMEWAAVVASRGNALRGLCRDRRCRGGVAGQPAIAKAKAFTANAFSTDVVPMSTARLYTLSLPGHSLWSAANGNPFNPQGLSTPGKVEGVGKVCGGTIAFGGGVPLYKGQTRVGGLGVSGDTPCADHEIAKRVRHAAGLDPAKGEAADDIQYIEADGPTIWAHPLCPNTWRNGKKIGDEPSPKSLQANS